MNNSISRQKLYRCIQSSYHNPIFTSFCHSEFGLLRYLTKDLNLKLYHIKSEGDPRFHPTTTNQFINCASFVGQNKIRVCLDMSSCIRLQSVIKSFRRQLSQTVNVEKNSDLQPTDIQLSDSTTSPTYFNSNELCAAEDITKGDPLLEKKLKVLFLEADVWRQEGKKVPNPSDIKHNQWKELLTMNTRSARLKYLSYLWGIETKKLNKQLKKKAAKELEKEEPKPYESNNGHIQYGLRNNSIFMRLYDTTINHFYNSKLVQAMQYGQKIVVDCGYDAHMTTREAENAAKQIMLLFADNRSHSNPYDVYLCNANTNGKMLQKLHGFIPTMYEDHFPLNVTSKSYLELFPKEDLVYLTPHCREEITTYDHESVYIIGGIVDKVNQEPLSLAKAKREGLRMGKLPLDRFLNWGAGSGKSLTLNQMINILLEIKSSGNWAKALQFVPTRKLIQENHGEKCFKEKQIKQFRLKRDKMSLKDF